MRLSNALALLALVALVSADARWTRADERSLDEKIRVLLVTGGHDFEEQSFYAVFEAITDVKTTKATYPAAAKMLTPDLAKDYDAVVFYDMWTQRITASQQAAFVKLLNAGIGVVAIHHTLAAHPDWPEYARIIGGRYHLEERTADGRTVPKSGYLHDQDIRVRIADPDHAITRGLKAFEIYDETYYGYDVDRTARVLLTTDHPKSNKEIAWVKTYGNSRVCYIQLGHDHHAYENPSYRSLVARSIRWAAGWPADPTADATQLFNGKDLSGWMPKGNAHWEVKDGLLIGRQGPDQAAGDLLTEASFDDFELTMSFKVVWPANSGLWYRYQSAEKAYQADILEYKEPRAYSGTLYYTGKMFVAINDDPDLVHRDGWNQLVIRAVDNRHVVFLNGKNVADVRDDGSKRGQIGLQVHPGDEFADMQIIVKEIYIRRI